MLEVTSWIRAHYRTLILATLCFGGFIFFEAHQQLFYARNFTNGNPVTATLWGVFVGGFYRWMIWLVLAVPLVLFVLRHPIKQLGVKSITNYAVLVAGVLFLNLALITLNNVWQSPTFSADFSEIFTFYFFHKAPIIFVALIFLTILVHFFKNQGELSLSIQEMGSLKYTNQQLYEQINDEAMKDETMVIQVKVGNRVKLVPLESIVWIEADDYCVRIHDQSGRSYTLRSTMKALEQRLPASQFMRVHRKALVNLSAVKEYAFGSKPMIILNQGTEIPLAQSRVKELRNTLQGV